MATCRTEGRLETTPDGSRGSPPPAGRSPPPQASYEGALGPTLLVRPPVCPALGGGGCSLPSSPGPDHPSFQGLPGAGPRSEVRTCPGKQCLGAGGEPGKAGALLSQTRTSAPAAGVAHCCRDTAHSVDEQARLCDAQLCRTPAHCSLVLFQIQPGRRPEVRGHRKSTREQ